MTLHAAWKIDRFGSSAARADVSPIGFFGAGAARRGLTGAAGARRPGYCTTCRSSTLPLRAARTLRRRRRRGIANRSRQILRAYEAPEGRDSHEYVPARARRPVKPADLLTPRRCRDARGHGVVTAAAPASARPIRPRLAADGRRSRCRRRRRRLRSPRSLAGSPSKPTSAISASVDRALAQAEAELGPVDVWVNNAGIQASRSCAHRDRAERKQPLDALRAASRRRVASHAAVHLDGTFYGTRGGVLHGSRERRDVNIASVCGIEGCTGFPHYPPRRPALGHAPWRASSPCRASA